MGPTNARAGTLPRSIAPASGLSLAAVARIELRWHQAGLLHWAAPACEWAMRFGGIEDLAGEPRLAPTRAVWRLALHYMRQLRARGDVRIATTLARLPFAHWRARWPAWALSDRRPLRWNPLELPLPEFVALASVPAELIVWEGARPTVPLRHAVAHLLARMQADRGTR